MKRQGARVDVCEYLDSQPRVVVAFTDAADIGAGRINDQSIVDEDRRLRNASMA